MPARPLLALVAALAVVEVVMRIAYGRRTLVVFDEFQHLHAAYLTARGQTPYVDFFEHHTPLFYYLGALLLPLRDATFDTVILARYLALGASLVTVALVWRLVRRLEGWTAAWVVVCLLLANFFLFARAGQVYLDTFAIPFVVASLILLMDGPARRLRLVLSGAALSTAVLLTQKAVVVGIVPALYLLRRPSAAGGRWRGDVLAWAAGGLAPWLLVPALIGVDGLADFYRDAVGVNLAWKARRFPVRELLILAVTDGAVYGLALIAAAARLRDLGRRRLRVEDADLPALAFAALVLGIFLMPVVWEEYFLLVVPFAVAVAGTTLWRWTAAGLRRSRHLSLPGGWPAVVLPALALVAVLGLAARALVPEDPLPAPMAAAAVGGWLVLAGLIVRARRTRAAGEPILWLLLLLVSPLVQQAHWITHNSNAAQRARVEYVLAHSTPDDAVFDGYTGYGVFRPHAYRYWFLHEEMLLLLSEAERSTDVVRALERTRPALVVVDDYVAHLPEVVGRYLAAHYEATAFPEIRRRRADGS